MKWNQGFFGGNMTGFECRTQRVQIICSDGMGGLPQEGKDYKISIYNHPDDDEPVTSYEGKKFNLEKMNKVANRLLKKVKS
jgi:hypothetical protein